MTIIKWCHFVTQYIEHGIENMASMMMKGFNDIYKEFGIFVHLIADSTTSGMYISF